MAGRGLVAGRPAAAQDGNAIVVTAATAARYRLRTISDLAKVAGHLIFGGPPECVENPSCLPGLKLVYGLRFREFVPLDSGGPLTRQALLDGDVSVALLFTTDPAIRAQHLVVLTDNRGLQPAENVVPDGAMLKRRASSSTRAGAVGAPVGVVVTLVASGATGTSDPAGAIGCTTE